MLIYLAIEYVANTFGVLYRQIDFINTSLQKCLHAQNKNAQLFNKPGLHPPYAKQA